jgi:hypothetical protein
LRLPLLLGARFLVARSLRAAFGLPGNAPTVSQGPYGFVAIAGRRRGLGSALRSASGKDGRERHLRALDASTCSPASCFAFAYWAIDPGVAGLVRGVDRRRSRSATRIYFSFITISTLGYGDISPLSEPARGMAVVEAVSGQMYLAVLVARLVSLYSREHQS